MHAQYTASKADYTHYIVYIRGTFSNVYYVHNNYVPIG